MSWKKVDKELRQCLTVYRKNQIHLKDQIRAILKWNDFSKENIYRIADHATVTRFRREIERNKDYLPDGLLTVLVERYQKLSKVRHIDMLKILFLLAYAEFYHRIKHAIHALFQNVAKIGYNEAAEELKQKGSKMPPGFIGTVLATINNLGYVWADYIANAILYNAEEMSRITAIELSKGTPDVNAAAYQIVLEKQRKRDLNENDKGRFSGAIENQSDFVYNQAKAEVGKQLGAEYARFVSVGDARTTKMCDSMDGMIFSLNDVNEYLRYSEDDKRKVLYTTFGLQVGENLPPINNHFHYCRSTITYLLDTEDYNEIKEHLQVIHYHDIMKEEIDDDTKRAILRSSINLGKITLTLNHATQAPHMEATKKEGKSYFTISEEELQDIVNQHTGTGLIRISNSGQIKETIELDSNVGIVVRLNDYTEAETNRFTIHYSKKRTHVVPTAKRGGKDVKIKQI